MLPWVVSAIWLIWFIVIAFTGYAPPQPGDKVDHAATRISVRADLVTLVSLLAAIAGAIGVRAAVPNADWLIALGAVLVAAGLVLRHRAAAELGRYFTRSVLVRPGQHVVDTGPYRLVRHPGYLGILISELGLALTLRNWFSLVLIATGFFLSHVPRILAEESTMATNLGEPYREFARTRKRVIPGIW